LAFQLLSEDRPANIAQVESNRSAWGHHDPVITKDRKELAGKLSVVSECAGTPDIGCAKWFP
jgi:hypothetical protein